MFSSVEVAVASAASRPLRCSDGHHHQQQQRSEYAARRRYVTSLSSLKKRHHQQQQQRRRRQQQRRQQASSFGRVRALVSVDVGPAAVLGTSVMLSSIALYQIRASRPEVSRDKDVFFSSVGLLCGGILVFQGWRLDPLMLFGQLMTAGTAIAFASETISLRQNLLDVEEERGYDGGLEDDYEDDEDYEEFGGRRGRKGRRGGGRGRRNNRGYALPSQTQSGFRRFDDSFEDLYEDDDDDMERGGGRGFSSVQQEVGGSGGRYVGSGGGSRKGIPPSASAAASSSFSLGEEDEEDLGSDFSREFRRSRRKDRDEDEDADASSSSPSSSSVSSKPSLDVWGSEGDDVF